MAVSSQFEAFPYVVLALAPFAPSPEEGRKLRRVRTDLTGLDAALEALAPTVRIEVPAAYCPDAWITVAPRAMRDFRPERLIRCCGYLNDLEDARGVIRDASRSGEALASVAAALQSRFPRLGLNLSVDKDAPSSQAGGAVDDILAMVAMPEQRTSGGKGLAGWLEQVEDRMSGVLRAIYNDAGFRALEASWRGAQLLLQQAGAKEGSGIVLELAPCDPKSPAFDAVLEALIADLAVELPHLVVVDTLLDSAPQRIAAARSLAVFAETLLTPTVTGIGPGFFHLEDWSQLGKVAYIGHYLEDSCFAKWRALRKETGGQWLCAAMNAVLARPVYGKDLQPRTPFFQEQEPLWVNPAWAVAALAAKSVAAYGWPSRLTDYHTLKLENLAVLETADGPLPTAAALGEDRLAEFAEAGFAPVVGMLHKDAALVPRLPAVSGDALAPRLFLNRVLGFLFWCKENMAAQIESGDVAANVRNAFGLFWQHTGHTPPEDLRVSAGEAEEGSLPLFIHFTPPKSVLPAGGAVEFTFSW